MKTMTAMLGGAAMMAALILACGDDTNGADAATCECPVAEPPITNGRVVRVSSAPIDLPMGGGGGMAACPTGSVLLTGGCGLDAGGTERLFTSAPASEPNTWLCGWDNTGAAVTAAAHAYALCLMPAP